MKPTIATHVGVVASSKIFGFPVSYTDRLDKDVDIKKAINVDIDGRVKILPEFNKTGVVIPIDFDFTER